MPLYHPFLISAARASRLVEVLKYKPVDRKVRPVPTTLPEEFRIVRRAPADILADLPQLPLHPPSFSPGLRYTQERYDEYPVDIAGWLSEEERRLVEWLVLTHEHVFAWEENEKGAFTRELFDPILLPTIEHTPWVMKNIPIPPGIYEDVCQVLKTKIEAQVYEPSNSSYRSKWFCVLKKDKKSLRLVHDLQPLNTVAIQDVSTLPSTEDIVDKFGGRACYGGLDLLVAFDQRELDVRSRDMTTFQTPFGAYRLTSIPMGYTNSMQILQGDVTFIFRDEIPHITDPFADDCNVKGPASRYELEDGTEESILGNLGIRRFIWEHCENMNRILHRMGKFGGTFSGKKLLFCVPELEILGYTVHYQGRSPDVSKVQKIKDWPPCETVTEVRGFLGTCGLVRIFIKGFATLARPLINLTRKDAIFEWTTETQESMDVIKEAVCECPMLTPIDYNSDKGVILAVDSSHIAVGFVLLQETTKGKRRPARFGSIAWNERESRYSQAKLELYGLFRAMKAYRIYIIGVKQLTVEVDAKYIKGMLNNPDILPSASVNRWIAGIKLFRFTLVHVPGIDHKAPDGLSRRRRAAEDPISDDDVEEWIDNSYCFFMHAHNKISQAPRATSHEGFQQRLADTASCAPRKATGASIVLNINTTADTTASIPRSENAIKQDARINEIRDFLNSLHTRPEASVEYTRRLVAAASKYFLKESSLWKRDPGGNHKLVMEEDGRLGILRRAHDELGHKGKFAVRAHITQRFWWPALDQDVAWYLRTCHQCQLRQLTKILIPPPVVHPAPMFMRWHIDTMFMPKRGGFRYIVHARCSLGAWPEFRPLRSENAKAIGAFIFEQILCRWGAVHEIISDNGKPFVAALEFLAKRYNIRHIKISAYNSRANGVIERRHRDVREAIVKTCEGDLTKWLDVLPSVFWAERCTVMRSTGLSPFEMSTGIEPRFPWDIIEANWLVDELDSMTYCELVAIRARQLQRRDSDLELIDARIRKSRFLSREQFIRDNAKRIVDYNFQPGTLVLIRNTQVEAELDRKTKPRYYGPLSVVRRTTGGSYTLAELDGSISKTNFAAFRIVPYHPRQKASVQVTPEPEPSKERIGPQRDKEIEDEETASSASDSEDSSA